MREIKFRQWMSRYKSMHYGIGIVSDGHWAGPPTVNFSIDPLMQFTGLYDKNGKEIYEGDILVTSNDDPEYDLWDAQMYGPTIVQWDEKWLSWTGSDWCWDDSEESVFAKKFLEVIGNIYENPDLLK